MISDDEFLERWIPIDTRLRAVEERYRIERIRVNGKPYPEGAERDQMRRDMRETCELYRIVGPEHREILRGLLAWSYILHRYLESEQPDHSLPAETNRERIRFILAAKSLKNFKADWRDDLLGLGDVCLFAAATGIDIEPLLQEAAALSSDSNDFHAAYKVSMRELLSGFTRSEFFKHSVLPHLERGEMRMQY